VNRPIVSNRNTAAPPSPDEDLELREEVRDFELDLNAEGLLVEDLVVTDLVTPPDLLDEVIVKPLGPEV
jgi:hypothetical protein